VTLAPVTFGGQWRTPVFEWEGAHYPRSPQQGDLGSPRQTQHSRTVVRAGRYELRVQGPVSGEVLEGFEELQTGATVETVLHGRIRGQEELHRLLEHIDALGLELVAVRRLPGPS